MKFAYADPPYFGSAKKLYGKHHSDAGEYDDLHAHKMLIGRLMDDYSDGWALSMTSGNLHDILPLCPKESRIAAWVKPFAIFKPNVNPGYTWEPVVFFGGRKGDRTRPTVRDYLSANITLKKGLTGAKPDAFCDWILDLLGFLPDDTLDDLFPGTGSMGRALERSRLPVCPDCTEPHDPRPCMADAASCDCCAAIVRSSGKAVNDFADSPAGARGESRDVCTEPGASRAIPA